MREKSIKSNCSLNTLLKQMTFFRFRCVSYIIIFIELRDIFWVSSCHRIYNVLTNFEYVEYASIKIDEISADFYSAYVRIFRLVNILHTY